MKFNTSVSSARRKQRKAHFGASSSERRVRMAATLSAELRSKHGIRSLPIHKDDEVRIIRGDQNGREGKVISVYRLKYAIHVEKVTRDKVNGNPVHIPIDASKVVITKLKLDKNRNALIARKVAAKGGSADKGKGASTMSNVD
eukprot:TRINITY_DN10847_c0_g1_i1.p1 TRINITY_DN10847_c0_g1~~TRINITY_DN10847_c0_g1_i1.p1  ORF type:complete len:143 (+),score=43.75 TRINITY_DN10847_c0_g1_i1:58-486(+)